MSFLAMGGGAQAGIASSSLSLAPVEGGAGAAQSPTPIELSSLLPSGWQENSGPVMRTVGSLLSNPFFSAGAGLWLLTVGGSFGKQAMLIAQTFLRRRYVVSMEMTNQDSSYEWMMRWLASQPRFKVQQISVMTRTLRIYANDAASNEVLFGPCPNVRHFFFYEGRPVTLTRRRNDQTAISGEVLETLQFTTFGRSSAILENMMKSAEQFATEKDSNRTVIYINTGGRWSRQQDPRPRRPLESVILPAGMSEELLTDVRRFLRSGDYYRNLGVPYRRGYLLHGPPGCGKTSYVMALAGELRLSICLLSLSNRALNDETLMTLLNTAELRTIVLMEDIDRAFSNECNVTMSGLLNALDGVGAQEGRLVFMTTNHVERLDPALIRPGRADVKVEVGLLDHDQARRMFVKFYPDAPVSLQEAFASQLPPHTLSAAQIQSHLFFHRDDPQEAVDRLPAFISTSRDFDAKVRAKRESERKQRELPRAPLLNL